MEFRDNSGSKGNRNFLRFPFLYLEISSLRNVNRKISSFHFVTRKIFRLTKRWQFYLLVLSILKFKWPYCNSCTLFRKIPGRFFRKLSETIFRNIPKILEHSGIPERLVIPEQRSGNSRVTGKNRFGYCFGILDIRNLFHNGNGKKSG